MAVVVIKDQVTPEDLATARQDYGDYIKVVADVRNGVVAIGGQWHADAERILLEQGSLQADIWGGGLDLLHKTIDTIALINLRPTQGNDSQEILNPQIRQTFTSLVKEKFAI